VMKWMAASGRWLHNSSQAARLLVKLASVVSQRTRCVRGVKRSSGEKERSRCLKVTVAASHHRLARAAPKPPTFV
jgi:hypothetical protein